MANSIRVQVVGCVQEQPLSPQLRAISLTRSQVLVLRDPTCQGQILCDKGLIWITQDGNPEDYMLRPGERFTITQPSRVVILACGA